MKNKKITQQTSKIKKLLGNKNDNPKRQPTYDYFRPDEPEMRGLGDIGKP